MFRAQWMSELKPSSGASGISDRLLRPKGQRRTQEIAREEKVSCATISSGPLLNVCRRMFLLKFTELLNDMSDLHSGYGAVPESRARRAEWSRL